MSISLPAGAFTACGLDPPQAARVMETNEIIRPFRNDIIVIWVPAHKFLVAKVIHHGKEGQERFIDFKCMDASACP